MPYSDDYYNFRCCVSICLLSLDFRRDNMCGIHHVGLVIHRKGYMKDNQLTDYL